MGALRRGQRRPGPWTASTTGTVMDTDTETATMSVADAGRLLGISTRSAYRAATAGQLPTLRIGRRLLVPTAKLHDLLGLRPTPDDGDPAAVE